MCSSPSALQKAEEEEASPQSKVTMGSTIKGRVNFPLPPCLAPGVFVPHSDSPRYATVMDPFCLGISYTLIFCCSTHTEFRKGYAPSRLAHPKEPSVFCCSTHIHTNTQRYQIIPQSFESLSWCFIFLPSKMNNRFSRASKQGHTALSESRLTHFSSAESSLSKSLQCGTKKTAL